MVLLGELGRPSCSFPDAQAEAFWDTFQSQLWWLSVRHAYDRLGIEVGCTSYLGFFPATSLIDLIELHGTKLPEEDLGLLASWRVLYPSLGSPPVLWT